MNMKGWITLIVVCILSFGWIIYCNTGARRMAAEVEVLIEQQCRTYAECRVNDDGTAVNCWVIDTNDEVEMYSVGEEYPTHGEIEVFCRHIEIVRMSI